MYLTQISIEIFFDKHNYIKALLYILLVLKDT